MFRSLSILILTTAALAAGGAAWAKGDATNAKAFSAICMGTAPSFGGFAKAAKKSGFTQIGKNWVLSDDPAVVISVEDVQGGCSCQMTMPAPDLNGLVQGVFQTLLNDYPNSWTPEKEGGMINDTWFLRAGERVRLILQPYKFEGDNWLGGMLVAQGACRA